MHLLMVGMEDDDAASLELADALLRGGVELQLRLRIGRRRPASSVIFWPPTSRNVAMFFACTVASAGVSSGIVDVEVARQAERLVLAVADVAALQRALRLQLAAHCRSRSHRRRPRPSAAGRQILPTSSSDAASTCSVRFVDPVSVSAIGPCAVTLTSAPVTASCVSVPSRLAYCPSTIRGVDRDPANRRGTQIDAAGEVDAVDGDARRVAAERRHRRRPYPSATPATRSLPDTTAGIEVGELPAVLMSRIAAGQVRREIQPREARAEHLGVDDGAGGVERQRISPAAAAGHVERSR